jgi:hypothetical protein
MKLYLVKVDLFGLKAGSVERFSDHKAGALVVGGEIEPFDPKNPKHAGALKAQEKAAEDRRLAAEAQLKLEREKPEVWRAQEIARRREHEKADAVRMGKQRRELAQQRAAAGA